jgi:hypothetical protein
MTSRLEVLGDDELTTLQRATEILERLESTARDSE